MTSSYSNIWKRFLFNNQSTIYNNEKIKYNLQIYNSNSNDSKLSEYNYIIEKMIIDNLEYIIIFSLISFYTIKRYI